MFSSASCDMLLVGRMLLGKRLSCSGSPADCSIVELTVKMLSMTTVKSTFASRKVTVRPTSLGFKDISSRRLSGQEPVKTICTCPY